MKDELLMRFIDGTATPEEVETVMEMLSKDDEAAKEWMQMVNAASLVDTPAPVLVNESDAETFVLNALNRSEAAGVQSSKKVRRLPWIIGGVAAAAAAIAFVVTLSLNNSSPTPVGNLQAGIAPEDTIVVSAPSDTIVELQNAVQDIRQQEYLAETKEENTVVSQKQQIDQVSTAGKGTMTFQDTTAVSIDAPVFNVLKPAKSPYRVKVKNIDKDFVFEWEASCVATMSLVITDSKGVTLMDKSLDPVEGKCPVKAAELTNLGELTWILTASFEDDNIQVRTGKIELVMN